MNKKGFSAIYGLMLGVVVILLAMALAPGIQDVVTEHTTSTLLNCSAVTGYQAKTICTSMDLGNLYTVLLMGIGGIIIIRSI